jgi:CHRD domain
VCWEITTTDVVGIFAAHIHRGAVGVAGPIEVHLSAVDEGTASGCVAVDRELIKEIRQNPSGFYVNVHANPDFGAGAIRGQLG